MTSELFFAAWLEPADVKRAVPLGGEGTAQVKRLLREEVQHPILSVMYLREEDEGLSR